MGKILVTKEEYEAEQQLIMKLEREYAMLAGEWASQTTGRTLVSREEYEKQAAEIRRMEAEITRLWSRWGLYMARRRLALERGQTRAAAAYLGLIRATLREIRDLSSKLAAQRSLHGRKVILTPELEALRRRLRETWGKLEAERKRLARKVVTDRKIIAMHRRWEYDSPRGDYHDISIEAVASMVIPVKEPKEKYEKTLKEAMENELYAKPGFERLKGVLSEKIEGFQEKLTLQPLRGVEVHALEWWHEVYTTPQLDIEDYLPVEEDGEED